MKNNIKNGDLVYIPSGTRLEMFDKFGNTKDFLTLEQPRDLIVTEQGSKMFGVLFNGKTWYVNQNFVYKTEISLGFK
jgi:hypothetical protein